MGSYKTAKNSHVSILPDETIEIISPSLTKYVIKPIRYPVLVPYHFELEEEDDIVDEIEDIGVHCSCNALMTNSSVPVTCPRCGDTICYTPDEDDDIIDGLV